MPERIQLSRAKGWRMPEDTVKVDRSTPWGNSWQVWRDTNEGRWMVSGPHGMHEADSKPAAQAKAVDLFRADMQRRLAAEIYPSHIVFHELTGKNLACWCTPGTPCHADVLLELANEGRARSEGGS